MSHYMSTNKLNHILCKLYILFCLFPYIQIVPLGTDSQPYALLLGIIITCEYGFRKLNKYFLLLFVCMLFAVLIFFLSGINMTSTRSLINYISVFIIPYATFQCLRKGIAINYKIFKICIYIWLFVGITQLIFWPSFCTFLLPRGGYEGIGSIRGATSLAPEPTFYAIICVLYMILSNLFFHEEKDYRKIQLILLFQIFIIARSTTIILLLIISVGILYLIKILRKDRYKLIYFIAGFIILFFIINAILPYIANYRIGILLNELINKPSLFLVADESVNERFVHAFFPFYAFIQDLGIPHLYNTFGEYMAKIAQSNDFSDYISYSLPAQYPRIMSGLGSAAYELGLIGLIIPIVLICCVSKLVKKREDTLFFCILFIMILLNAMPLSNALAGMVYGSIIYRAK